MMRRVLSWLAPIGLLLSGLLFALRATRHNTKNRDHFLSYSAGALMLDGHTKEAQEHKRKAQEHLEAGRKAKKAAEQRIEKLKEGGHERMADLVNRWNRHP